MKRHLGIVHLLGLLTVTRGNTRSQEERRLFSSFVLLQFILNTRGGRIKLLQFFKSLKYKTLDICSLFTCQGTFPRSFRPPLSTSEALEQRKLAKKQKVESKDKDKT